MSETTDRKVPAVFVVQPGHLAPGGGGVQLCTREYFATLDAAGFALTTVEAPYEQRLTSRILRRVRDDGYWRIVDERAFGDRFRAALIVEPRYVFLNQRQLAVLAPQIRHAVPNARIVLLSHGLESTDYLHEMRTPGGGPAPDVRWFKALSLGSRLVQEARQVILLWHVFCLSDLDQALERWLGAGRTTVIPRVVEPAPLDWQPQGRRIGFVGTLSHQPSWEGLLLFLDAAAELAEDFELRVVGSPSSMGEALARRSPRVTYLGPLSDVTLSSEAATWNCCVHPLFCFARGASTKLAVALGWEIPVVTTTPGARGYSWSDGQLPIADDPAAFARLAISMLQTHCRSSARENIVRIVQSSPSRADIARLIRRTLLDA